MSREDYVVGKASRDLDADRKRTAAGAATGAGAVTAGVGLLGGGIPGVKPDSSRLKDMRYASPAKRARDLGAAGRGGIFGYRQDAHQRFMDRQMADDAHYAGSTTTRVNHFLRGKGSGKVGPEKKIIGHMRRGRIGSNAALIGGSALTVAGIKGTRDKGVAKAREDTNNALIGGGATLAGASGAGSLVLDRQGRKWSRRSEEDLKAARKIVPNLGGYTVRTGKTRVPDVKPDKNTEDILGSARNLAGKSRKQAEAAGRLRGSAGQGRYFAGVYGSAAQQVRRIGIPAGLAAVGTGLYRKGNEKR